MLNMPKVYNTPGHYFSVIKTVKQSLLMEIYSRIIATDMCENLSGTMSNTILSKTSLKLVEVLFHHSSSRNGMLFIVTTTE